MANKLVRYIRGKLKIIPKPVQPVFEPVYAPFRGADGLVYSVVWDFINQTYLFDWYMEIGCKTGTIFSQSRSKTIAVDPYFQVTRDVILSKPVLHIFQTKSDDFFQSNFLEQNKIILSASFLDGMHLFEYLLRDFINTERNSLRKGVIAMHDCCPRDNAMTTRDLDSMLDRSWTGDVWKILPILQQYRPDLKITVLDCHPTGLVVVSGLDPSNKVLADNYDDIIKVYGGITLDDFGVERFYSSFVYTHVQSYLDAKAPDFARAAFGAGIVQVPSIIAP